MNINQDCRAQLVH